MQITVVDTESVLNYPNLSVILLEQPLKGLFEGWIIRGAEELDVWQCVCALDSTSILIHGRMKPGHYELVPGKSDKSVKQTLPI